MSYLARVVLLCIQCQLSSHTQRKGAVLSPTLFSGVGLCLSVRLSACLSVSLSVCLCLSVSLSLAILERETRAGRLKKEEKKKKIG